jgi:hypothetical protein
VLTAFCFLSRALGFPVSWPIVGSLLSLARRLTVRRPSPSHRRFLSTTVSLAALGRLAATSPSAEIACHRNRRLGRLSFFLSSSQKRKPPQATPHRSRPSLHQAGRDLYEYVCLGAYQSSSTVSWDFSHHHRQAVCPLARSISMNFPSSGLFRLWSGSFSAGLQVLRLWPVATFAPLLFVGARRFGGVCWFALGGSFPLREPCSPIVVGLRPEAQPWRAGRFLCVRVVALMRAPYTYS